ncbi:MAG: MFS transporter [Proteobacteria bacterium]|nr:MFS transporter [Pseudomonadota bacterium]
MRAGEGEPVREAVAAALGVTAPLTASLFLGHVSRTVHAVIAPELAVSLKLEASVLGLLSAVYYLAYGLAQLPLGLALDRFGPRRVQVALLLIAVAGTVVFAVAADVAALALGRALIGAGMAASLMALLKGNATAWPRARLPLINGAALAFGATGSMAATVPVELLLRLTDWRSVFLLLAALTAAVALLIALAVPDPPRLGEGRRRLAEDVRRLAEVYASPVFWRFAPATALSTGTLFAYLSLWLGPWLRDVAGLDLATSARYMLAASLLLVAGFVATGLAMERLARRGLPPTVVFAGFYACFMATQLLLSLRIEPLVLPLWGLFAFFATIGGTAYSIYAQHFPAELVSRASTAQNLFVLACGFAIQTGIGVVIDLWPQAAPGRYAPAGYQAAMWLGVALQALAFAWLVLPRRARAAGG